MNTASSAPHLDRSAAWIAEATGGSLANVEPDFFVSGPVVTDSRKAQSGSLFVAINGENSDGHDFVHKTAGDPGSVLVLASRSVQVPHVLVSDTVEALGKLAQAHLADLRAQGELSVVGITGSVGKTTTKDLTGKLLSELGPTVFPQASFNNEIGLPLTVLEATPSTRYLVLEMGASGPGHIDYLTEIAPLDLAVVLMVGHAHMGGFGGIEAVATAKSEIVQGLLPDGLAVLNADDERVAAMASLAPGKILTFSASGAAADVRATEVELNASACASFKLHVGAETAQVQLGLPGVHNTANALAAACVAATWGMSLEQIAAQLRGQRPTSPHRMDVQHLEGGMLIIDDAYNANIDSVTAALAALPELAGERRRVVVLSEMLELEKAAPRNTRTWGTWRQTHRPSC